MDLCICPEMLLKINGLTGANLRPTLIYGTDDPHNSYGPNNNRLATKNEDIILYGEGEELGIMFISMMLL